MSEANCSQEHPDVNECRRILSLIHPDSIRTYKTRGDIEDVLQQLRILARSKDLNECFNLGSIEILVSLAKDQYLEAQKCLYNIILNYPSLRNHCIEPYIDCLNSRQFDTCSRECLYFDCRIMSLLSALCPHSRKRIYDKTYETVLKLLGEVEFTETDTDTQGIINEALKVLFNLTVERTPPEDALNDMVIKLLSSSHVHSQINDGIMVNIIHLLANVPSKIYEKFTKGLSDKMLEFLSWRLSNYDNTTIRENLLPTLNCCVSMCKSNASIRKDWKNKILSKTTNYAIRPEHDDSIRGDLVNLMTSVDTQIKDVSALLIFILCKESVNRFIKYTGYGNAAGFLANRGLMRGGQPKTSHLNDSTLRYSSDSETSDTEEYIKNLNKINPITGAYEEKREDPMKGMSEEQKERHAVELASMISTLSEGGIIKPMGIDKEGNIKEISPANFELGYKREAENDEANSERN